MLRAPRRGTASSSPGSARRVAVSSPFEADVCDDDAADVKPTRRDGEADLRGVERHREICIDDRSCDLARGGIDSGGEVDRHDRRPCCVDALDDGDGLRPRSTAEPRSEQSVDHDVVAVETIVDLIRDVAGLAKDASSDTSVSAVRPSSTHAREAARGRIGEHRLARDGCVPARSMSSGIVDGYPGYRSSAARISAAL